MSGLTAYCCLLSNPAYPGNAELQLGTNFSASCFQIPQEAVECSLIDVVLFPVGEVADVALAFHVSCPSGCALHDCFINCQKAYTNGVQQSPVCVDKYLKSSYSKPLRYHATKLQRLIKRK